MTKENIPKSIEDVRAYFKELGLAQEHADEFFDHFESNGWKVSGKAPMKNWQAAARNWKRKGIRMGTIKPVKSNGIMKPQPKWECPECHKSVKIKEECQNPECPTNAWKKEAQPSKEQVLSEIHELGKKMSVR